MIFRALPLVVVVLVSGCSVLPKETSNVTVTETGTITAMSTETATVTATSTDTVTAVAAHSAPSFDGATMYECHGDAWANLYQWPTSSGTSAGSLTIVLGDGEAPLIDPRMQIVPMSVSTSGDQVSITIADKTTVGRISASALTVPVTQRDGSIAVENCVATDIAGWNQVVAAVRPQTG